jgi:hypothetical protein
VGSDVLDALTIDIDDAAVIQRFQIFGAGPERRGRLGGRLGCKGWAVGDIFCSFNGLTDRAGRWHSGGISVRRVRSYLTQLVLNSEFALAALRRIEQSELLDTR